VVALLSFAVLVGPIKRLALRPAGVRA
jgi:hypothetical protein